MDACQLPSDVVTTAISENTTDRHVVRLIRDRSGWVYTGVMNFQKLVRLQPIESEIDLIRFYGAAIDFRNVHKEHSADIALYVFDATNQTAELHFHPAADLVAIRYEFGALEAPGTPNDPDMSYQDFDDMLWERLHQLVKAASDTRAAAAA